MDNVVWVLTLKYSFANHDLSSIFRSL